jgi:hypothetical protein
MAILDTTPQRAIMRLTRRVIIGGDTTEGMKDGGKWIQDAVSKNPGSLHRQLHIPQGEKIPEKKLAKAAHSDNPTLRRRAALAKTLKGFH